MTKDCPTFNNNLEIAANHTLILRKTPSKPIISERHESSLTQALMMASTVPLTAFSGLAAAAEVKTELPSTYLPAIHVYAKANTEFKKDKLENVKYTQPLVDTPQTITVITEPLIEEQKAYSLAEALRNTPGITMQLGENGRSSEGDAISFRGFSGDSLFLVDGIRNIAPVSRDTFNVESIEVTKGVTGAEVGRGATAGAINIVTKKPKPFNDSSVTLGVDSAAKSRLTADLNQVFEGNIAGRLNLLYDKGNVVGRDEVEKESFGVAPSVTWGLGTPTRVTAGAELLYQRNIPDGGISTVGLDGYYQGRTDYKASELDVSALNGKTAAQAASEINAANKALNNAAAINSRNYYGNKNDFEDVDSQLYNLIVEHDFNDQLQLTNTTRYADNQLKREVSAPYQAYNTALIVDSSGKVTEDAALKNLGLNATDPSTWRVRAIRQGVDRTNTTLANQTNINLFDVKTGSISHDISTGIELLHEKQVNHTLARSPDVNDYPLLYAPDVNTPQSQMIPNGAKTKGQTKTVAGYISDTLSFNDKLKLNAGLRADNYHTSFEEVATDGKSAELRDSGTLISYKGALVYKPTPQSSLYTNYGVSQTPPGSSNFSLANTGRNATSPASNPIFDPQDTKSFEIGGKIEVLNDRLSLGAAYYDTTHENELAVLDSATNTYTQFGKRTIKGIELTAQGELTPRWRLNAGLQTLKTKIKDGTTGINSQNASARWSPELTGTLWSSYDINDKFTIGGGARYVGEQKRQTDPNANLSATNMPVIPDYWVADAYASYRINDALSADLNVYNIFDKEYIETLNNGGGRATLGEPLNALLTLKYKFR